MKHYRNPEIRKELIIFIIASVAAAAGCLFINPAAATVVFALGLALTAGHYHFSAKRYRQIASLSSEIDRILHGQQKILIADSNEGELAILNSEIHKMTVRLKEQTDMLTAEKVRLTEAIEDIFHQLRTPLTSLNIIASLLTEEDLTYERRTALTRQMKRQLERMQWMVESLLKISKIDAGTAVFRSENVSVKELIKEASQPFLIPIELKNISFAVNTGDESFTGDMAWTVEALSNLIKNSIEHTPEGGTISVSAAESPLSLDLEIRDSGEGFDKADIPYLFDRFYKGKNASNGSIGIGLALARMIIVEQNGTITASNSPEGGACFTIKFYKSVV